MTTTTIRLPPTLKARVAKVVKRSGATTHSFVLEAIAEKTRQEELRAEFETTADARFNNIIATGKTIPWQKMRTYLEDRSAGKPARRPKARKAAN